MKRTRVAGAVATVLALLAVAVGPAAAQPSENIGIINPLNLELLYVAAIIAVVVQAMVDALDRLLAADSQHVPADD